jgi:spoIIIJ-associated protein
VSSDSSPVEDVVEDAPAQEIDPAEEIDLIEDLDSDIEQGDIEQGDIEQGDIEQGDIEQGSDEEGDDQDPDEDVRVKDLEQEGDIAADYLEELLDIADLDGDLDIDVEGDRAAVSIVGADLQQLVGHNGEVLDALQELTRLAVYRETGDRSRLMLDVSGFRAEKRERLVELASEMVEKVRDSGEPVSLDPMTPFERKVVHDAVAAAGLSSESEGVEPRRFVVVLPS